MILEVENIFGGYIKNINVLNDISFSLSKGETLAVIGQNGAGKSSLAKAIINSIPFRTGKVRFNDKDISSLHTQQIINFGIGYFLQGGRIFPHLNILDNLRIPARHFSRSSIEKRLAELSELLPVLKNHSLSKQASELSGGEKHQLALCMVLFNEPKLLILDEPSAGLSPQNIRILYDQLLLLKQKSDISILLIEQNIIEAVSNCNNLIVLSNGTIARSIAREEFILNKSNKFLFENLINL